MAFREDSHFYFLMPLPILRRSLLEMGRRLRDVGLLGGAGGRVFHLRLEEARSDQRSDDARERREAALGRAHPIGPPRRSWRGFGPDRPDRSLSRSATADATHSSRASRPAAARRPAGKAGSMALREFGRLAAAGDVLVCPYTNPAWTTLFQRAAARSRRLRGPGSHAAIVARSTASLRSWAPAPAPPLPTVAARHRQWQHRSSERGGVE